MNKRINPLVYPAFLKVEIYAYEYVMRNEVNRNEYDRCKEVIVALEEMAKKEMKYEFYSISAQEWYAYLQSLGIDLPSLYLDRRPTEDEIRSAGIMQRDLESKLAEIMIKHSEFVLNEIKEELKRAETNAKQKEE